MSSKPSNLPTKYPKLLNKYLKGVSKEVEKWLISLSKSFDNNLFLIELMYQDFDKQKSNESCTICLFKLTKYLFL